MAQRRTSKAGAKKPAAARKKPAAKKPAAKKPAAKKTAAKKPAAKSAKKSAAKKASKARDKGRRVDPKVAKIQEVIDVMVASGAVEVELRDKSGKLRIRLKEDPPFAQPPVAYPSAAAMAAPPAAALGDAATPFVADAPPAPPDGETFRSPMVGTFYRAPSPETDPFVKVGDRVDADSVVCIIEAMKVMNEIKAEMEGEIIEILVQNGEPVDYGQPLFVIR